MEIHPVPLLKDNYGYVLKCKKTGEGAFVDCSKGEHAKALAALKQHAVAKFVVMSTHRHDDHSGGNPALRTAVPELKVYGGARDHCAGTTDPVEDGAVFKVGALNVTVMHTPCHTKGHVLYFVEDEAKNTALFTGDTIFVGGVGAFFEGKAEDMVEIMKRVVKLPPKTLIYCGHEYAMNFFPNAAKTDKDNAEMKERLVWAETRRAAGLPTVPSTLADEMRTNLYMRTVLGTVSPLFGGKTDPVELMEACYDTV